MSIQSMNDQELVCLYIGGNHQALETLIRRHQSRIFSAILMVMRDRATAEDVFQDTFIRVIQTLKKGEYNEEGKFLPWVLRISRNLVIDHYRRVKKMPPAPVFINEEGEEVSVFNTLPAENDDVRFEQAGIKREMRQLINQLPDDQREVVLMRLYYDMSFKEIASFTNVSINTALGRMRYALFNLKKMIGEHHPELSR